VSEPLEGVLEPWTRKISIEIEGRGFLVPENQDLIRIYQYLGCLDALAFFAGHYCWNATCNNCFCTFVDQTGQTVTKRACQTRAVDGMKILKLPKDVRLRA
jgi:hypothetical protein